MIEGLVERLRAAGCVYAEEEAALILADGRDVSALVERRVAGEPLEYVLGWAEFCGLRIAVTPGVFIPRRRTELLAQQAAALLAPGDVVVELCCGSGAISAALIHEVEGIEIHAADIDPFAVACARENLPGAAVYEGDLFAPIPAALHGQVSMVVANTPYVPSAELEFMPREAQHEPRHTIVGGDDGLDLLRRIVAEAGEWLRPGGHVLIELSEHQLQSAHDLLPHGRFDPVETDSEEANLVAQLR